MIYENRLMVSDDESGRERGRQRRAQEMNGKGAKCKEKRVMIFVYVTNISFRGQSCFVFVIVEHARL